MVEDTKEPASDLNKVGLFHSYPWKHLFINPYIEAVVNDFNATAQRYEPFDRMLRSDIKVMDNGCAFYTTRKNNGIITNYM